MSRPLVPRLLADNVGGLAPLPSSQRPKKISTACGACKARKTRCSGGAPCDACASRQSDCIYDASADQRRKVASQRNKQDLETAQRDLEKHRELLGGMIATFRAGDYRANDELIRLIRSGVDLSQLAAHVRNDMRSNLDIQQAFQDIVFIIDGPDDLPSPRQVLGHADAAGMESHPNMAAADHEADYDSLSAHSSGDVNMFGVDPAL